MNTQHTCHAANCKVVIPPKLLMCGKHWKMVPEEMQQEIYRYYRPGQEVAKNPRKEWVKAASNAVSYVLRKETEERLGTSAEGKISFPVMSACCHQCLITPNRIVNGERMREIVDQCLEKDTWFQCHLGTLNDEEICCRGFFDAFGGDVTIIRLAKMFQLVEEKDVKVYQQKVEEEGHIFESVEKRAGSGMKSKKKGR